jgi:hypothetical protein
MAKAGWLAGWLAGWQAGLWAAMSCSCTNSSGSLRPCGDAGNSACDWPHVAPLTKALVCVQRLYILHTSAPGAGQLCSAAHRRCPCLAAQLGSPPVTACLWGHYTGDSYNSSSATWQDLSGNGRHTTVSRGGAGISVGSTTRGTASFSYLQGGPSDGFRFATAFSTAAPYTFVHVTRWVPARLRAAAAPRRCGSSHCRWLLQNDRRHAFLPLCHPGCGATAAGAFRRCQRHRRRRPAPPAPQLP